MSRTINIWSRSMDRRMDHIRRRIEKPAWASIDDLTRVVNEDKIRFIDQRESDAEWVNPETIWLHRISEGDVSCDTFVETIFAEDAECCGEAAFQVFSFFVFVFEFWWSVTNNIMSVHVGVSHYRD